MKSHDLANLLLANPNVELILQKDAEGNDYSPLSGIDFDVVYVPDSTWSGEVYAKSWTADDCLMNEDEWEDMKKNSNYAVLFPVN